MDCDTIWLDPQDVSEKVLEDWCAEYFAPHVHPKTWLLGRQVTLPSGRRLDLLFAHRDRGMLYLTVVELKAGRADVGALDQCVCYVDELRRAAWTNLKVRGVLAATSVDPMAWRLASEMEGVAIVKITTHLHVSLDSALHDWTDPLPFPLRPPDVDTTQSAAEGYRRWEDGHLMRNVIGVLMEDSRPARDRGHRLARLQALVPLRLTPRAVAYPNGTLWPSEGADG